MIKLVQICICLFLALTSYSQVSNLGTNSLTSGGATTNQAAAPIVELPSNTLSFSYDTAGNQTRRTFLYLAPPTPRLNNAPIPPLAKEALVDKLLPTDLYEDISYYPNPIKSELYLQWVESASNDLQTIELYNLNGKLLNSFPNQSNQDHTVLNFENYPVGYYNLLLRYSNEAPKTLKIVKQ